MGFLVLAALTASAVFPALLYREEAPTWRLLPRARHIRKRRIALLAASAAAIALLALRVPLVEGAWAGLVAAATLAGSAHACRTAWRTAAYARRSEGRRVAVRVVAAGLALTAAIVGGAVLLNPALGWEGP